MHKHKKHLTVAVVLVVLHTAAAGVGGHLVVALLGLLKEGTALTLAGLLVTWASQDERDR